MQEQQLQIFFMLQKMETIQMQEENLETQKQQLEEHSQQQQQEQLLKLVLDLM